MFHRYSMTSTIRVSQCCRSSIPFLANSDQRLLDHLKEAAFFTAKDLESIGQRLDDMQESLQRGKDKHSPHLLTLLSNRLTTCRGILEQLQISLAGLSPELTPTHERLVSILRSISAANTRTKVCRVFYSFNTVGLTCYYSFRRRRFGVFGTN